MAHDRDPVTVPSCFAAAKAKLASFAAKAPHLDLSGGHQQLQDAEAGFRHCVEQKKYWLEQAAKAQENLGTARTMTRTQREALASAQRRYDACQRAAEEAWRDSAASEGRRLVCENESMATQASTLEFACRAARSATEHLDSVVQLSALDVDALSLRVSDALQSYNGAKSTADASSQATTPAALEIDGWQVVRCVVWALKDALTISTVRSSLLSKPRIAQLDATKILLKRLDELDSERTKLLLWKNEQQQPTGSIMLTATPDSGVDYADAIAEVRARLSCCTDDKVAAYLDDLKMLTRAQRERSSGVGGQARQAVTRGDNTFSAAVATSKLELFDAKVSTRILSILDEELAAAASARHQPTVDASALAKMHASRVDELHASWLGAKADLDAAKRKHCANIAAHNAAMAELTSLERALGSLRDASNEQTAQLERVTHALSNARQLQQNAEDAFNELLAALATTGDAECAEETAKLKTIGVHDIPSGLDEEREHIVARVRKFAETKELSDYVGGD